MTVKKKSVATKKPAAKKKRAKAAPKKRQLRPFWWLTKQLFRVGVVFTAVLLLVVILFAVVNPPTTPYILSEGRRLGGVDRTWVPIEEISPYMARAVVAAEDANFCNHWGFDVKAIRAALNGGARRGASTITQQVVKNVYLWQGRSWLRKALEAVMTPMVEAVWTKRRIIEVYLNVVEFDEGVFGVDAASRHYFRVGPTKLSAIQAARLAVVLPSPKTRSAAKPTNYLRKRAFAIVDGAATIRADGRAACFEG